MKMNYEWFAIFAFIIILTFYVTFALL